MRSYRTPSFDEEQADINLTPLIDVVFVVLIMFIVIAPLLNAENINLAEGTKKAEALQHQGQDVINIYLKKGDLLYWKNQKVEPDELQRLLIEQKQQHPQSSPNLFTDKEASFGSFQKTKKIIELAGFESLNVVLKPG